MSQCEFRFDLDGLTVLSKGDVVATASIYAENVWPAYCWLKDRSTSS